MFQDVIDGAVLRRSQEEYEAQKKGIVGQITVEIDSRVIHVKGYVAGTNTVVLTSSKVNLEQRLVEFLYWVYGMSTRENELYCNKFRQKRPT
jgi:hypothetical protein